PPIPEDDTDAITLSVVNHHPLNVVIYNVAHGHRDRIGEVTTAATSAFTLHLRRYASGELQLLADPIGSPNTVKTETLHLVAGDVLAWTIEDELARSHYEIR
ncbi:MAG TPA: hypothetical protein VH277_02740, partial [Gemmatimonadaceae bacterium]|nr:hypothetical protein [Gemmatimonadaceae bacterium]